MSIEFSAVILPVYDQMLAGLGTIIEKAKTFCEEQGVDERDIVTGRLAPDMLHFAWQVKLTTDHAVNGLRGALAAEYVMDKNSPPETLAELADLVQQSRARVAAYDHGQLDALVDREVLHVARDVCFSGERFVTGFSMPNFFFHLVTAYDILRMQGVPVGKADYLGQLPTRS